ncbi:MULTISPECIES: hypothetical protein [unclassified Microcoleus]|uniref:hypothetical protein n=1 Tax=unclassified Microcoleus TaxID=2642155 RepID=UPI002FD77261
MFRFLHEQIIPAPVSRTAIAVPGSGIAVDDAFLKGVLYIWDKLGWVACGVGAVGVDVCPEGVDARLGGVDARLGRQALE